MKFKTWGMNGTPSREIKDVVKYVIDHINKFSKKGEFDEFKIYIGCDSQDTSRRSVYATAIVIHRIGKGAHVIYYRDSEPKIKDTYTRLWGEVERSLEVAEILREGGIRDLVIDLDINGDAKYKSNRLLSAGVGMVKGQGFKYRIKPDGYSATYTANKLCR